MLYWYYSEYSDRGISRDSRSFWFSQSVYVHAGVAWSIVPSTVAIRSLLVTTGIFQNDGSRSKSASRDRPFFAYGDERDWFDYVQSGFRAIELRLCSIGDLANDGIIGRFANRWSRIAPSSNSRNSVRKIYQKCNITGISRDVTKREKFIMA